MVSNDCSVKKGVPQNFAKFTGKHLCQSLFFNWVAGIKLMAQRLWHRCFPMNFFKVFKNTFFTEHLRNTAPVTLVFLQNCFPLNFAKFLKPYFPQNTSGRLILWYLPIKWLIRNDDVLKVTADVNTGIDSLNLRIISFCF